MIHEKVLEGRVIDGSGGGGRGELKGPCSEPLGTGDAGLSRSRWLRQVHCLAPPLLCLDFSFLIPRVA